jgi:mannan endo-1,4-beta-mannosidase
MKKMTFYLLATIMAILSHGFVNAQTNLVTNPGYETGSISPWTGSQQYISSVSPRGNYCVRLGTSSGAAGTTQQVISVQPNTTYTLSAWLRCGGSGINVQLGADGFGGSVTATPVTSTSWTKSTLTFTTGSTNTSVRIFATKASTSATLGYADDFELIQQTSSSLTVSPTSVSFGSGAQSQSITVSSNISWTVSKDQSWISTSVTGGSNNGSFSISVQANTGSARSGNVTVSGGGITRTISVSQDAASSSLTVTPSSMDFIASGASAQTVTVSSNVSWTVSKSHSWISTSSTGGSNNGSFSVSVSNNTGAARSGSVTVSGGGMTRTISVAQACGDCGGSSIAIPNPGYETGSVSPWTGSQQYISTASPRGNYCVRLGTSTGSSGTTQQVISGLNPNTTYTLSAWLRCGGSDINVQLGADGFGGSVTATPVTSTSWTKSTLTFTTGSTNTSVRIYATKASASSTLGYADDFELLQEGPTAQLTVSPTSVNFGSGAQSQSISVTSNVSWTVSKDQSWITTSVTGGSNNGSFSISVQTNTGSARSGNVTVSGGGITRTITVSQNAASSSLTVTPSSLDFVASGASAQTIIVTSNVSWTVSKSHTWISTSSTGGSNNGSFSVSVSNNTGAARSGSVTVSGGGITRTISVSQACGNCGGGFTVQGTKIYGPDGKEFIVKGANVTGQGSQWSNTTITDKNLIINCWKFNTIRLYFKMYTTSNVSWQDLLNVVDNFSASNIVVIIDAHDKIGSYYEGSDLNDLKARFRELAIRYKNNPYVWFDICNEPGQTTVDQHKWTYMYREVIKVIRDEVGNNNIILIEGGSWGQDGGDWGTGNVDPNKSAILRWGNDVKTFNNKTYPNIVMSIHIYDQYKNGGATRVANYLQAVKNAGHAMVVGEWGNWNNGDVSEAMEAFATVLKNGTDVGRIVWHWQGGDNNKLTSNGGGRSINSCSNPTNLSTLGRYVWQDNHNTLKSVSYAMPAEESIQEQESRISVYPNPVSPGENITVKNIGDDWSIRVTDISGRTIRFEQLTGKNEHILELGQVKSGVYFLIIQNGNSRTMKKLVVN